jgi:hypothetical protein
MKKDLVELAHIDHFVALLALVKMLLLVRSPAEPNFLGS